MSAASTYASSSTSKGDLVKSPALRLVIALGIVAIGVYLGASLISYSDADDAPGGVVIGYALIGVALLIGMRTARRKV
jgi:hypothetical protein